jgi:transcriptional regulator with XRE-family HTH domain
MDEDSALKAVGRRIRQGREANGLTLHELARLTGISAPALSQIETGKRDLRVSSLHRIAAALRIAPGTLFDDRPSGKPARSEGGQGYDLEDYR